jgi:hypothetical protein
MGIGNIVRALIERGTKIRWIRYHMLSYRNGQPYELAEQWVRTGVTTFTFMGGKYDAWERGYEKNGKLHCLVDINKKEPIDLAFTTSKGGIDPTRYKTETDNKVFRGIILGGKESILPWIIAVTSIVAIIAVTYILTNNLKVSVPVTTITSPPIKVG